MMSDYTLDEFTISTNTQEQISSNMLPFCLKYQQCESVSIHHPAVPPGLHAPRQRRDVPPS
jgi:hypothetical protein